MKKIAFLIQIIEGYKVTFYWISEKGQLIHYISNGYDHTFLKAYDPISLDDYLEVEWKIRENDEEDILESEEIESEIRERFGLTEDCPIYVFDDGDQCLLVRRSKYDNIKRILGVYWRMITIDGKDYYTWDEVVRIIQYVLENNITVEEIWRK